MMKKTMWKQFSLELAITILLTACGTHTNSSMPNQDKQSENGNTATGYVTTDGMEFLSYYTSGYASDTGFYRRHLREDSSENICYVDFATGQEIVLCNQPNCMHDSDSCNAWVSGRDEYGNLFKVIPVADKLILLRGGWSENLKSYPGRVEIMNLDGTNRHTIMEFPLSTGFGHVSCGGYARNEENLYFIAYNAETWIYTLYQINAKKETVVPICELPEEEEQIIGCTKEELILSYTPGGSAMSREQRRNLTTKIIRLNPATGEKTDLFEHPACDYGTCADEKFYILNSLDKTICTYDLMKGNLLQKVPVAGADQLNWETVAWPHGFYDGRLLVDNNMTTYFGIDPNTGEIFVLNHTYSQQGSDQSICQVEAETEDSFLIDTGLIQETCTGIASDGKTYTEINSAPVYSLISKEDFWNNNGNGMPIVDARN